MSTAYATAAEYRTVTRITDAALDGDIEVDLRAVSRYLDGELRRTFVRDAVATTRHYMPLDASTGFNIDDLSETPTQVAVDTANDGTFATIVAPADYRLFPLNALTGPEPWPFTRIELAPAAALGRFPAFRRVRITGRFGWPSVPVAIQRATIHLTAILRLESARATKRIPELGDTLETSHQAQNIIRQLTNQYKVWLL